MDLGTIYDAIQKSIKFSEKYPDFFIGYDLVGYEETGHTLLYYLKDLLLPEQEGKKLKYFFHAGETDWSGTDIDNNLVDALLLNTSRIGHGYAIYRHPEVKKLARERGVAIEVCPISNQVLKLVDDLRNHPASNLLVEGYPVVISSDDPGLWGARGLSYDWYETFMGLGGKWADLRMLKQLAMDSFRYSSLDANEMKRALSIWSEEWDSFINQIILIYNL